MNKEATVLSLFSSGFFFIVKTQHSLVIVNILLLDVLYRELSANTKEVELEMQGCFFIVQMPVGGLCVFVCEYVL